MLPLWNSLFKIVFAGDEGVGGGGGGGGKQRHNSDKNIREYFSKHPSSSPVRHAGAKSPSPQGANYPMVIALFIFWIFYYNIIKPKLSTLQQRIMKFGANKV